MAVGLLLRAMAHQGDDLTTGQFLKKAEGEFLAMAEK